MTRSTTSTWSCRSASSPRRPCPSPRRSFPFLHYRSFDDRKIELRPGITVLVGRKRRGEDQPRRGAAVAHGGSLVQEAHGLPSCSARWRGARGSRIRPRCSRGRGALSRWGSIFPKVTAPFYTSQRKEPPRRGYPRCALSVLFCPRSISTVRESRYSASRPPRGTRLLLAYS